MKELKEKAKSYEKTIRQSWANLAALLNESFELEEAYDYLTDVKFENRGLDGIIVIAFVDKEAAQYSGEENITMGNQLRGLFFHLTEELELDFYMGLKVVGPNGETVDI